jgi:hypothetical protein
MPKPCTSTAHVLRPPSVQCQTHKGMYMRSRSLPYGAAHIPAAYASRQHCGNMVWPCNTLCHHKDRQVVCNLLYYTPGFAACRSCIAAWPALSHPLAAACAVQAACHQSPRILPPTPGHIVSVKYMRELHAAACSTTVATWGCCCSGRARAHSCFPTLIKATTSDKGNLRY